MQYEEQALIHLSDGLLQISSDIITISNTKQLKKAWT